MVRMSTTSGSNSASVVTATLSWSDPTARATITGVSGDWYSNTMSRSAATCQRRSFDAGLYTANAISAPAKARILFSTCSQGFNRSDNDTMPKSCPSGAPTRLATACAAVIPGTIRTGTSRHCGSSATSSTAAAMANTPGSPEDTTATRRPRLAISNAMAARSASTLLSERCLRCPARSATRLT